MAENKGHQNQEKIENRQIRALFDTRKIKESPIKVRDTLLADLGSSSGVETRRLLATAVILSTIPRMLTAEPQNELFWSEIQKEFILHHGAETDNNFDFKMPLREMADAAQLIHSLSMRTTGQNGQKRCEISADFSVLVQRHCVRHWNSIDSASLKLFAHTLKLVITSRGARYELIRPLKDVCCECLVSNRQQLCHRAFADLCQAISSLELDQESAQWDRVVSAVEKYLQREIDSIEPVLMYSIAISIQLGNRPAGGRPLSSVGLQALLASRVVKDQVTMLAEMEARYGERKDGADMERPREKQKAMKILSSYIDCVSRTGSGSLQESKKVEIIKQAMGVTYLLREHIPPRRLTQDLERLSEDHIYNKEYKNFLVKYLEQNIGELPFQHQVLLPKLMHHLSAESQKRVKASYSDVSDTKEGSLQGVTTRNRVKVLQSLVEAEGKNVTQTTASLLRALFADTGNIFSLKDLVKTLDEYEVSRSGNEDLWDCIYEKTQSQKSQMKDFDAFQKILLSLSNQGKEDPKSLQQVGQLLHGTPVNALTVESVLHLRNNVLKHHPDRNDIQGALEMRAIAMLYKFGQRRGVTTLSANQAKIQEQFQTKKSNWSNNAKPKRAAFKTAAATLARAIPR